MINQKVTLRLRSGSPTKHQHFVIATEQSDEKSKKILSLKTIQFIFAAKFLD
jgi:hypothetical protein